MNKRVTKLIDQAHSLSDNDFEFLLYCFWRAYIADNPDRTYQELIDVLHHLIERIGDKEQDDLSKN